MSTPPTRQTTKPTSTNAAVFDVAFETARGLRIAATEWKPVATKSPSAAPQRQQLRVLALHGYLDNGATWDNFLIHLFDLAPDAFHVVAIDFAGHGFSDYRPVQQNYGLIEHVEEAVMVVDRLGWESFIVLGHSMGGAVGTLLAAAVPERVSHLIVVEALGPYHIPGSSVDVLRFYVGSRNRVQRSKTVHPDIEAAIAARMNGANPLSKEAATTLMRRSLLPTSDDSSPGFVWTSDSRRSLPSPYYPTEEAVRDYLKAIECPVLSVWGSLGMESDFMVEERSQAMKSGITIVRMPGTHHLHLEPETASIVAVETLEWLRAQDVKFEFAQGNTQGNLNRASSDSIKRVVVAKKDEGRGLADIISARL